MLKTLSQKLASAIVLAAITTGAAQAQTMVQYSTLYSFTGSNYTAAASQLFGTGASSVLLTFLGQAPTTVTSPSYIDYGTVTALGAGSASMFNGQQIYLEIVQTLPSVGTAQVVGSISGAISMNSSGAVIDWNEPSRFATIGTATYELEKLSSGFTSINAPTSGPQTIRGYVSAASTVPEPSTWALMGTGLVSLAGVAARRRRTTTA